jgi:hypothetical protein
MVKFYFTQNNQIVNVKMVADDSVNAWSGSVVLPSDIPLRIFTGDTITKFWQKTPVQKGNLITFTGGIPSGFQGDGVLFGFAAGEGSYDFSFSPETAAYLNDGEGTKANTILQALSYSSGPESISMIDREPPQPFSPLIYREKGFFDGNPVLIFSAEDNESGISHYEARETLKLGTGNWHRVESPYLINSDVYRIQIKAVDAFGNERIAVTDVRSDFPIVGIIFVVLVIGAVVGYLLYNKFRK